MKQWREICLHHCASLDFPINRTVFQSVVWIAVSFQLIDSFSYLVTFAQAFHLEASFSECHRITHSVSPGVFTPLFNGISFVFLEEHLRHSSRIHIYQSSQHTIPHPYHKSQSHMPSNWIVSALILSQMLFGCFLSYFPVRLRSIRFIWGVQSQSSFLIVRWFQS